MLNETKTVMTCPEGPPSLLCLSHSSSASSRPCPCSTLLLPLASFPVPSYSMSLQEHPYCMSIGTKIVIRDRPGASIMARTHLGSDVCGGLLNGSLGLVGISGLVSSSVETSHEASTSQARY